MRTLIAVVFSLPAIGSITSAQASTTVCTKDALETVTCETQPRPKPTPHGSSWLSIANGLAKGTEEARQNEARRGAGRVAASQDSARTSLFISRAVAVLSSARDSLGLIGNQ